MEPFPFTSMTGMGYGARVHPSAPGNGFPSTDIRCADRPDARISSRQLDACAWRSTRRWCTRRVSSSIDASRVSFSSIGAVSYTHLRAHETRHDLVCRLLLEKK